MSDTKKPGRPPIESGAKVKRQLYVRPDYAEKYTNKELSDMLNNSTIQEQTPTMDNGNTLNMTEAELSVIEKVLNNLRTTKNRIMFVTRITSVK